MPHFSALPQTAGPLLWGEGTVFSVFIETLLEHGILGVTPKS